MDQNSSRTAKPSRHIIAEAGPAQPFTVDSDGYRELLTFLAARPAAFSAWCDLNEHLRLHGDNRSPIPAPPAAITNLVHPDHLDAARLKQRVTDLTAAMIASREPAERENCIGSVRRLVDDPKQRRLKRRTLMRRIHRLHYGDLKDHAAAEVIAHDLARRFGTTIISTGNVGLDALIDEALLYCARPGAQRALPSARNIRRDLAPG